VVLSAEALKAEGVTYTARILAQFFFGLGGTDRRFVIVVVVPVPIAISMVRVAISLMMARMLIVVVLDVVVVVMLLATERRTRVLLAVFHRISVVGCFQRPRCGPQQQRSNHEDPRKEPHRDLWG
jgi:hypothetical protein